MWWKSVLITPQPKVFFSRFTTFRRHQTHLETGWTDVNKRTHMVVTLLVGKYMYCRENAYSSRERVVRPIFIWKMRKSLKKSIRQKRSSNPQKRALAPYSRVVLKLKRVKLCLDCYWFLFWKSTFWIRRTQIAQSSLSSKYLRKCKYVYSILQNQYLWIYEDSFGAKILRDDCGQSFEECLYATFEIIVQFLTMYL